MQKRTWVEMGIIALGLLLVCGAVQGEAQEMPGTDTPIEEPGRVDTVPGRVDTVPGGPVDTEPGRVDTVPGGRVATEPGGVGTGQGRVGTGQGTVQQQQQQATGVEAQRAQEIAQLRAQVLQLQQQLARMQARLDAAGLAQEGVGGAGPGADDTGRRPPGGGVIGDPAAEAPEGATGLGVRPPAQEGTGGGGETGTAVANVIYEGRVRSVSQRQLVLEGEEGDATTFPLARDVRVIGGNGRQVSIRALKEGMNVRATADMLTRGNPVTRIEVLVAPSRDEE